MYESMEKALPNIKRAGTKSSIVEYNTMMVITFVVLIAITNSRIEEYNNTSKNACDELDVCLPLFTFFISFPLIMFYLQKSERRNGISSNF
jgi:hypothetical protein